MNDSAPPSALKVTLRRELNDAMKSRDELRTATLRMVLTAITNEEVSGKQSRVLSDADVVAVLAREAKKRREAAIAYDEAGRQELATRERDEELVIAGYLPAQLTDEALTQVVADAIRESGAAGPAAMGSVMKAVTPRVAGQADGGRVAAEVRRQLSAA